MNFMLRTPLWPLISMDSKRIGSFGVTRVPMLDLHEIAAGKLAALFGRWACRDLFDVRELLQSMALNSEKLRLGFVVYGAINRRDWRSVPLEEVETDSERVERDLLPLLRADVAPSRRQAAQWTRQLVGDCRSGLSAVLPLNANELEFLERLNDDGEVVPEILTVDHGLQATIRTHPGLLWKAANVREHRGLGRVDEN